ncbi:aspartate aminotransferase family protein [Streptomyces sp. NPDC091280]|uniref:aminotransferase family protein n=1 Tax=Streptomyces sp. NPDC091280 TaxID=3365984 RepID=UPI0037F91072
MSTTGTWAERDRAVVQHPWLDADATERAVIVRGAGATVWDSDGRAFLDAESAAWLTHVGHGRAELAQAARRQAEQLGHISTDGVLTSRPAIELAERLLAKAPPNMARVRFANCGSEADDDAFRFVRLHHARRGEPDRTWILSLEGCFHGRCYSGAALQGFTSDMGLGPMLPQVRQVIAPLPQNTARFGGADPTEYCVEALRRTIDELGAQNIAALFAEPVMAGPGMVELPADYWPRVSEVLRANGILLVFDEVVTAFGRCGDWFAANLYGVEPDIIVVAKGIASGYAPLGALLLSAEVATALTGAEGGGSYGGHAVACAVANANLDVIEAEGLVRRSAELGRRMKERLAAELASVPVVDHVSGCGMMLGVHLTADLVSGAEPAIAEEAIDSVLRDDYGVLAMCYHGSVNLVPPLVLTDDEADRLVAAVVATVRRIGPDGSLAPLDGAR